MTIPISRLAPALLVAASFAAVAASPPAQDRASAAGQAASASQSAGGSATPSGSKSSRALLNQRMRKCKEMTGDEKTACERDAHSVSAAKARHESGATGK
jgi:hypothetical protein